MSMAQNLTQLAQYYNSPLASRNRLVNPFMSIDQANEGGSVTLASTVISYCADQWKGYFGQTGVAGTTTVQTVADAPASLPGGKSIKLTFGTGHATSSGDLGELFQMIEAYNLTDLAFGTSSASPVSLSFWVKTSLTGATFSIALLNSGQTRSYLANYTVSTAATWTRITLPNIPGDTTGTWATETNGNGLQLSFCFGCGSAVQGTNAVWQGANVYGTAANTNLMATTGATFQITGVQLEPGTVCTPLERRPFALELILCQRYFQKTTQLGTLCNEGNGQYGNAAKISIFTNPTTPAFADWRFPVEMRASPTILAFNPRSGGGAARFTNSGSDDSAVAIPSNTSTKSSQIIAGSNLSLGNWYINATADARL